MTLSLGYIRRLTLPTTGRCHYTPSSLFLRSIGVGVHPLSQHNHYSSNTNDVACPSMTSITKYRINNDVRWNSGNMQNKSVSAAINYTNPFATRPSRWNHIGAQIKHVTTSNSRFYSNSGNKYSSSNTDAQPPTPSLSSQQQPFVPMTPEEEENEKLRISQLSPEEKDMELRQLNRQISILEMKRGINTGELYTWAGKYKALSRDYGMPLIAYYWVVWIGTGLVCYTTITVFDVDVMYLLQQIDLWTGYSISEQVNPEYGKIGVALVINELIEFVRLPIVIMTVKPVIDELFPPKY
jgi:Protein of unknown function (DUF1279)